MLCTLESIFDDYIILWVGDRIIVFSEGRLPLLKNKLARLSSPLVFNILLSDFYTMSGSFLLKIGITFYRLLGLGVANSETSYSVVKRNRLLIFTRGVDTSFYFLRSTLPLLSKWSM